ncbi:IclR family transcriptional regulator [Halobium palmae]|uniref:IclR family transcriptional regulator n=1 Tax=Halobium palmae TaxID=1776492 RepID=A0ABD5RVX1_9EURY
MTEKVCPGGFSINRKYIQDIYTERIFISSFVKRDRMTIRANNPVKSLYTMNEIIDTLQQHEEMGVTELADAIDRPQSVVHNHLATLREIEYVVKRDSKYRIGLRFLKQGEIVRNRMPLYEEGKPVVSRLASETNELITLIVEEHGQGIYLEVDQSGSEINFPAIPGTRTKLHCSAAGKTILAHLSEERVDEIIERHGLPAQTSNTITSKEALFEELEVIRERGYAYDRQEFREGMRSIAAPLFDESNEILGGLSIAGPTHRLHDERLESELPDLLLQSVNVVELNYNEPNVR